MTGFIASYDQMTAVCNGKRLKFVFDSCNNCSRCAMDSYLLGCEIRAEEDWHTPTLCGGSRKDGRNGRWKEVI